MCNISPLQLRTVAALGLEHSQQAKHLSHLRTVAALGLEHSQQEKYSTSLEAARLAGVIKNTKAVTAFMHVRL
ncbi:hypothetical protein T484DRAFT_1771331 [Baffinella frigidus]|nr:hypothetical protein T484DRAFT_1771331 [Cryptophyta sp. CCMP2293]